MHEHSAIRALPAMSRRDHVAGMTHQTSSVRWTLASLSLPMLLSSLGTSVTNVALPTLTEAFGASFHEAQWVVLAYLLGVTTMIVNVGRLGDMIGRRRLLLIGVSLFTAASVVSGIAPTLSLLIAARAIQGLGGAVMMALSLALVGEAVPEAASGSAMGLLGTMSAFGTALGPSLGGLLISALGWRAVFLVNVPLGLIALLLARRHLPPDGTVLASNGNFDRTGSILLVLSLGTYALGMTVGRGAALLTFSLLAASALGIVAFWRWEAKVPSPLVPVASLRDPALRAGLSMSALVSTVMMATLVVGPFYLHRGLGLSAAGVGLTMSIGPLVAAILSVPAGRLVDRFGPERVTTLGLIGIAIGSLLLSSVPATLGVAGYAAPLVVATAGYALFQTANNAAVISNASGAQRGVIAGLLGLARNLGLITGASAMGALFALGSRVTDITTADPAAVITGMRLTFGIATMLVVVAMAVAQRGTRIVTCQ